MTDSGAMRSKSVLCLGARRFHRMHYCDWGDPGNPRVLVCVHGLTRNGRDFDFLARALAHEFRVVCPDIVGRGRSDWLEAKADYGYAQYLADLNALMAGIVAGEDKDLYWLGTSMGALLGILIAALPGNPIRKMIVNDAGTLIPKAALERIGRYVGKDPRFDSLDALEAHVRHVSAPFGALTDDQWRHLTVHGAKQHQDGSWGHSYDPAIGQPLQGELQDLDFSQFWDAVRCPTLLLRGKQSDVLLRTTAEAMTRSGPKAKLVEFDAVGHAPMLMCDEHVSVVREFLLSD